MLVIQEGKYSCHFYYRIIMVPRRKSYYFMYTSSCVQVILRMILSWFDILLLQQFMCVRCSIVISIETIYSIVMLYYKVYVGNELNIDYVLLILLIHICFVTSYMLSKSHFQLGIVSSSFFKSTYICF